MMRMFYTGTESLIHVTKLTFIKLEAEPTKLTSKNLHEKLKKNMFKGDIGCWLKSQGWN